MKRIGIVLTALFAVAVLLILIFARPANDNTKVPRFVSAKSQPAGPFGFVNYDWGAAVPFRGSKVWVWTSLSRTNFHSYLFDIDKQHVLGELLQGSRVFCNKDETRLLCQGLPGPGTSAKEKLFGWLNRMAGGKARFPTNTVETYWILDLRDNTARRIGAFSQRPGYGSVWNPSPEFRYGYNVATTVSGLGECFLCNLESGTLEKIRVPGRLEGWWDDHGLLVRDSAHGFVRFDVVSHKTSVVLPFEEIARQLRELNFVIVNPETVAPLFFWNGKDYSIFLTGDESSRSLNTFLVKVEREGPRLAMLNPNFRLRWLGQLDATGTHYLYPGERGARGAGGHGGVFLLDVTNNTTRTLVEPDNTAHYSLPRFYGDSVIYWTNRQFWRINLNGSNATPLFAPKAGEAEAEEPLAAKSPAESEPDRTSRKN